MLGRIAAFGWCVALVLLTIASPASAWIENHVLGDEVRIEVDPAGKALVEHRFTVKTSGSERLKKYSVVGIDRDAVPEANSYVIPARDALSNALDSATPLSLRVRLPKPRRAHTETGAAEVADDEPETPPAVLDVEVGGDRGLRRGTYVFVVRYLTDLRARGLLERDGSMVRVRWVGPEWPDGFDNARAVFVLPSAPTPPQAMEDPNGEGDTDEAVLAPRYLSEIHRSAKVDEVEMLRSYAPKGERIAWAIRVDQRALHPLPAPVVAAAPQPRGQVALARDPVERSWLIGCAAALFLLYTLLVIVKARQVARLARHAGAVVRPWVPLPVTLRAMAAGAALVAGVALQLLFDRPLEGAASVVVAAMLAAHGAARPDPSQAMRGPGRWLSVNESEAFGPLRGPRGASLDSSTSVGKVLLLVGFAGVGAAAWALWAQWQAPLLGIQVALDSVALLAVFGTGRQTSFPPDLAVEPIRLLRKLAARIRRMKAGRQLKLVPRVRIPIDQVDADELRLLIVPRLPLRGFGSIEVGVTYALGLGARVAMPEVLLRLTAGSPCERAVASLLSHGRIRRGRKSDERVVAFVPRLPTVRMTAEIVVALAARVTDPQQIVRRGRKTERERRAARKAKAAA